ncbi:hypothetical protein ACGFX2_32580 [Streptomyces goshikiensis]|uniref:hypothetical protein n=1 Tax=Streptomyces goshikiensis TaxID=1942 RepID=UPI00371615F2
MYVDPLPWTRQRTDAALDHAHCEAGGVLILRHVPPRAYTVAPRLDILQPDQADAVTGWKRLTLPYVVRGLHRRPQGLWDRENPALPAVGREPLGLVGGHGQIATGEEGFQARARGPINRPGQRERSSTDWGRLGRPSRRSRPREVIIVQTRPTEYLAARSVVKY